MYLHNTHERSVKIVRLWFLGIEDLNIICSTRNAEDFAVKEIA